MVVGGTRQGYGGGRGGAEGGGRGGGKGGGGWRRWTKMKTEN